MELWGDSGPVHNWSFAIGSSLGSRHDIVCDILSTDLDGGHALVSLYPCRTKARILGGLPDISSDVTSITILGAEYVDGMGMPGFRIVNPEMVMAHPRILLDDLLTVIELCCGIGIGTYGLEAAGFRVAVANDCNQAMLEGYSSLHPSVPLVLGNFADSAVLKQIHGIHPRSAVLVSGFSCQPFSEGGKKKGFHDERSATLHQTLRAAFLLRCPLILLECVKSASFNKHVRQELEQFRDQCHFHLSEIVLRLEDCWVSKRERWYAVLSAPMLGVIPLSLMPQFGFPTMVKQVVPRGIDMSNADLEQLVLGIIEHSRWKQFNPDMKSSLIPLSGKCPTALHSWGSQLSGCACGCRVDGFSDHTLATRGVYGILFPCAFEIELETGTEQAMRHPHPTEVALLNGVPVPDEWTIELKLALAGLGQQCAPFHIVWLASQIRAFIEKLHFGSSKVDCNKLLDMMREQILLKAKCFFGVHHELDNVEIDDIPCCMVETCVSSPISAGFTHDGGRNMVTVVDEEATTKVLVQLEHGEVTLCELIKAEVQLHGDEKYPEVFDYQTKQIVGMHETVGGRCLRFTWLLGPFTQDGMCHVNYQVVRHPLTHEPIVECAPVSPTVPFVIEDDQAEKVNVPIQFASDEFDQIVPHDLFDIQDVYTDLALKGVDHVDPDIHPDFADGVGVTHAFPIQSKCMYSDPVVALQKDQLCSLLRPQIGSSGVLETLIKQTLRTVDRLTILDTQDHLISDDEIRWHLNRILQLSGKTDWFLLDPLLLEEGLHRDIDCLIADFIKQCPVYPKAFVGVVRCAGHWIPFVWQWNEALVSIWSWDVSANHQLITPIHKAISRALGIPNFMVKVELRNFSNANLCGICAIRFVDCMVRGKMLPTCLEDVQHLHASGRELFYEHLVQHDVVCRPWTWGAGLDPKAFNRLQDLLDQHGVPKECIDARIDQAVQALGNHPIQQALLGSAPWKTLKALANNSRPAFLWVLPAELQDLIQKKATQTHASKHKKQSNAHERKQIQKPQGLDPSKVVLENGAFVRDDSTPLSQIPLSQVGPFAEGVALATMEEMQCHLKAGQSITQNALAVVVLNGGDSPPMTQLVWHQIRALVRCQANNEPLLVPAILVQLGKKVVVQARARSQIDIPAVPAACCKISIYRDMIEGSWQQFMQGPVRYLFQHLPLFEVCKDQKCPGDESCPKWHCAKDQIVNEPVLDVWRRQWLSLGFKVSPQGDSSIFVVNLRYVKQLQERLMAYSGRMGIFIEPRTLDSRSPLLDYQVLWLKEPLQELLRVAQVNPLVVGLARLGSRLGVRTLTTHASELAQQLKPGSIFLASGVKCQYEIGPLPYGMDRLTVSKVCCQWGWQARPMYPVKTLENDQGIVWLVQAVVDPPDCVFAYQGGEIIVTKIPGKQSTGTQQVPNVIASSSTLGLCALMKPGTDGPDKGEDPWTKNDPWSGYRGASVAEKVVPPVGLQEVEARIEKAVLARVAPMEVDDQHSKLDHYVESAEARFAALEQQVMHLHSGQQSLEQQFDASSKKCDAQLHHIQQQFSAQIEAQGAHIQSLFGDQMRQIESLLSKKARTE